MADDNGVRRVQVLADPWLVPAGLADFECEHGKLPGECPECDSEGGDNARSK